MLIAEIGPRPRLFARSDRSRQSTPRMTVIPDARIGAQERRSATRMALNLDGSRCSSSRKRETSSRP